ncbi:MAG: tRNA (adenosine(37)-N6)-threonylcarbamoyltransferase complex transferase subunit TsaD [Bacteroidota bacterium]
MKIADFNTEQPLILGIESSCDETSAAVSLGNKILANVISSQKVHETYGGVVPELASRAHQQQIVPVVNQALIEAKVQKKDLNAIAYTNGPGLMGSLLVGASFAKSMAMALGIPTIEVNHMQAHILAHFCFRDGQSDYNPPEFPFLCLTVSGGHTQIILVEGFNSMKVLGETLDDAAGEAFDKIAKILGLPYPGGPLIDKKSAHGNPKAFQFPHPKVDGLNFSFSGLKTSVLYFIQKQEAQNPTFLLTHLDDLCASVQNTIVSVLMEKLKIPSELTGIKRVAISGGVAANSALRASLLKQTEWEVYIPAMEFCTDNAGMIAVSGAIKYRNAEIGTLNASPFARFIGL